MGNEEQEFTRALEKNPKLLETLQKRAALEEFKERYHVARPTPFKCPTCSGLLPNPPSLWIDKDIPTRFICRNCKLEWTIICQTTSNEELIIKIKEMNRKEPE